MKNLDLKFLFLAAFCLTGGVALGIYMGASEHFELAPVHAHINLIGWASLALFGITYKLYPELGRNRLAKLHFILAAPSALAMPLGIYLAAFQQKPALAIIASFVWLAGVLLFLIQLAGLAFRIPEAVRAPAAVTAD